MKINNKGYAITLIVFGILIVFIVVLSTLLLTMNNSVKLNKTVKESVVESIQLGTDTSGTSFIDRIEILENNYNELLKTTTKNYNKLSDQIIKTKQDTINEIYPVGSVYITAEDDTIEKVQERFGGTWEKYAQGRTLVGVGTGTDENGNVQTFTNNSAGGEYIHKLTINEMPSHEHEVNSPKGHTWASGYNYSSNPRKTKIGTFVVNPDYVNNYLYYGNEVMYAASNGGDQFHNNIQPYITVYMYKRIK